MLRTYTRKAYLTNHFIGSAYSQKGYLLRKVYKSFIYCYPLLPNS